MYIRRVMSTLILWSTILMSLLAQNDRLIDGNNYKEEFEEIEKVELKSIKALHDVAYRLYNNDDPIVKQIGEYYMLKSRYYYMDTPDIIDSFKVMYFKIEDPALQKLKFEINLHIISNGFRSSDYNNLSKYYLRAYDLLKKDTSLYRYSGGLQFGYVKPKDVKYLNRIEAIKSFISKYYKNVDWSMHKAELTGILMDQYLAIGDYNTASHYIDLIQKKSIEYEHNFYLADVYREQSIIYPDKWKEYLDSSITLANRSEYLILSQWVMKKKAYHFIKNEELFEASDLYDEILSIDTLRDKKSDLYHSLLMKKYCEGILGTKPPSAIIPEMKLYLRSLESHQVYDKLIDGYDRTIEVAQKYNYDTDDLKQSLDRVQVLARKYEKIKANTFEKLKNEIEIFKLDEETLKLQKEAHAKEYIIVRLLFYTSVSFVLLLIVLSMFLLFRLKNVKKLKALNIKIEKNYDGYFLIYHELLKKNKYLEIVLSFISHDIKFPIEVLNKDLKNLERQTINTNSSEKEKLAFVRMLDSINVIRNKITKILPLHN